MHEPIEPVPLAPGGTSGRRGRIVAAAVATIAVVATAAVLVPRLVADRRGRGGDTAWSASTGDTTTPQAAPSVSASQRPDEAKAAQAATGTRAAGSGSAGHGGGGGGAPSYGQPVASDEFAGAALDTTVWGRYESTAANGSAWSPSMDRVTGGELQIVGVGRNPSGAGNVSGGVCWGCRGTPHRYGVWQLRARFDAGAGYAPVVGLAPADADMSVTGWITLLNAPQPARTSASYLVRGPNGTAVDGSTSADLTAWHTYTVEWRADVVRMYRDNVLVLDTTGRSVTLPTAPMYLFLQQEVGPTDSIPAPDGSTPNQVVMHFDWVRYYA